MKRVLSLLLILLLTAQVSFAQEIELKTAPAPFRTGGVKTTEEEVETIPKEETLPFVSFYSAVPFGEVVIGYIEAYIEENNELPTVISGIESFGITLENIEEKYYSAVLRNPHLLLDTAVRYYDTDSDGVFEAIVPKFLVADTDELEVAQEALQDGMQEYLLLAEGYDTDLEKLLAVHDKMVENCVYDERVMSSDPTVVAQAPDSVYHAIGVFRDKFAVCQGYSQALYMIGKEIGIEIDLCTSNDVNHMWNYVKMNGKWYHMDMTNEDPKDADGRATHRFFLASENKLIEEAHGTSWRRHGSSTGYDCTDTTYEQNHFFNTGFLFKGLKNSDGCYHASVGLKLTSAGIDTTITFKSPTLYTGSIIVAPVITSGNYTTTENGQTVTKTGTNLYTIERSVGTSPATFPIINQGKRFVRLTNRNAAPSGSTYLRLIFPDAEGTDLTQFTSFILGVDNLTPYSMKYNWR